MKLHRVLLFTSIQMDITPVGKDLHVLLTNDTIPHIGSTVYARVLPSSSQDGQNSDGQKHQCEFMTIDTADDPDSLFCRYTAETLARTTGQNVLCTGGIFTESPTERDISKLYENINEMITDWSVFFTDD